MRDLILLYYQIRQLAWPSTEEAMLWAASELGEASDILLQKSDKWIRNNPKDKFTPMQFGEELGDCIMMLLIAGYNEGCNPLASLGAKIKRKATEELNSD